MFSKAPFPEKNFTVNLHGEPSFLGFALVSQQVCSVFALPICVFFSPAVIFKSLPCHWWRENVVGDRLGDLMYIGLPPFHRRPTYSLLFPPACSLLVPMEWVEKDSWVPPVLSSTFSPRQLFVVALATFSLLWDSHLPLTWCKYILESLYMYSRWRSYCLPLLIPKAFTKIIVQLRGDDFLDLPLSTCNLIFQWSVSKTDSSTTLGLPVGQEGLSLASKQSGMSGALCWGWLNECVDKTWLLLGGAHRLVGLSCLCSDFYSALKAWDTPIVLLSRSPPEESG